MTTSLRSSAAVLSIAPLFGCMFFFGDAISMAHTVDRELIARDQSQQDGSQQVQSQQNEAQQDDPPVEATSLFGKPLLRREFTDEQAAKLLEELEAAHENYHADPTSADNLIWLGRRLAYLWRYQDAINAFTIGIERHPDDARMYRHRGHRYITTRQLDKAIADLEKAADLIDGTEDEVEPDGQPNAAGVPTSTLHTNIWYHLGLAHFLQSDFDKALAAYEKCLAAANNNDMRVATLDWMWMTLRRLERSEEAAVASAGITPEMEILENHAYHRRLLMYQGKLKPEDLLDLDAASNSDGGSDQQANEDLTTEEALNLATYGYGVGNWYLVNGEQDKAAEIFRRVTAGEHWAAFGFIAAEAELKRLENGK